MKLPLKELPNYFKNITKIDSLITKRPFIKTDKQILIILGIVFAVSIGALLYYWLYKERPYYNTLLTEKDELIKALKFTRDKQKKIYENAVEDYEKKLANDYMPKSAYDNKISEFEQRLNSYKNNYISKEEHIKRLKELEQQIQEKPSPEKETGNASKELFDKKIISLEQKISILEDKNLNLKATLEKSTSLIKNEKEALEDMLSLERKKAFIPSLILPETRGNALNDILLGKLLKLKDKLKNIEELNIPLRPETYFEMGIISYYNKQYDEAIEQWENAVSLNKDNLKAYICLGIAYHEKGMSDNAIKILRHAIEINPHYSTLHLSLARIYEQRNALDDAIYEYSKVLEIDPQAIHTHNIIGTLYEKKGLKEEARKSFAQYEKLKNTSK